MYENSRQARYNTAGSLGVNITRANPHSTEFTLSGAERAQGRLWRKHHEPYTFDISARRISEWPNLGNVREDIPNSPLTESIRHQAPIKWMYINSYRQ